MRKIFTILLCLLAGTEMNGQLMPEEGKLITYRIINFEEAGLKPGARYTLEIAKGEFASEADFAANVLVKQPFTGNNTIATVPAFGAVYTWRISGSGKAALHHFRIGMTKYTDTNMYRLRIHQPATAYKDGYVFFDTHGLLYTMEGEPVWYMPLLQGEEIAGSILRDMKMTNRNTITFLFHDVPYEMTWDGTILWKGPHDAVVAHDTTEHFHHEFTQLNNGNYMVLGSETQLWEPPAAEGRPSPFGTVIEYDKSGKVIWHYKSAARYRLTNYSYNRPPRSGYDVHQNSFYFDEKAKTVYTGFKNISQILKIGYPKNNLISVYGKHFVDKDEVSPFYEQHSLQKTQNGNLLVFNNNNPDNKRDHFRPKAMIFKEEPNGTLKTVWEYAYWPAHPTEFLPEPLMTNGGNAREMPDGKSIFVSMCSPLSDLFIVDMDKELKWVATPERYNTTESKWHENPTYRASMVPSRSALEKMIRYRPSKAK